jgi:predicted glycosyltransferase
LEQKGLNHTVVGKHYGKNIFKKIAGYPIRVFQLVKYLKLNKPDLAISQSSYHSALASWLVGIPSIYTNDNEHAIGNIPSFLFATKILLPENMSINKFKWAIASNKLVRYPGLKEGIFLWIKNEYIMEQRKLNPPSNVNIFIRTEPQTAQYYNGKLNFLDDIIIALQTKYTITVLTRNQDQLMHYNNPIFSNIKVPVKPLSFEQVASQCTLFIGAGGSMTREIAMLGIPTISVYQEELLDVDRLLIAKGLTWHEPNLTTEKVEQYLSQIPNTAPDSELMTQGKDTYQLFKNQIYSFDKKLQKPLLSTD